MVAYVGKNYFGQLSELHISESFTTDAIVLDKPEDCLCNDDFVFEMLNPSREGWTFHTQAEWNDMASYRWTIASPQPYSSIDCPYVDDNNTGSREDWMDFLYGLDISGVPNCMIWFPTPSGVASYDYANPATHIYVVWVDSNDEYHTYYEYAPTYPPMPTEPPTGSGDDSGIF